MKYNNRRFEKALDSIEEYIDMNGLKANDVLDSERKLSKKLGVSRGTLRKAINHLRMEGKFYTVHGKGTFIIPEKEHIDMRDMISFSGSVICQGKEPGSKLIDFQVKKADELMSKYLQIKDKIEIYVISRVRTIDGKKILFEISHIPYKYCPGLEKYDLEKHSLYYILEKVYRIQMAHQNITVRLARASKIEARYLDMGYNEPVFVEKGIAYSKNEIPMEYTKTIVNSSRTNYTINIGLASA